MANLLKRGLDAVLGLNAPATPPISLRANSVLASINTVGKPVWGDQKVSTYIDTFYSQNATIYACVMARALSVSVAPLRVYVEEDGQKTEFMGPRGEQHPIRDLISRPNPQMSEAEFWTTVGVIADCTNLCVIEKVRAKPLFAGDPGRPIELWPLRTDWLRPIPRDYAPPDWLYTIPHKDGRSHDPIVIKAEDVIVYSPSASPTMSLLGSGPMSVIFREASIHNALTDYVKAFFDNGGMPAYGLIPRADNNGKVSMSEGQAESILASWRSKFRGAKGLADIAIMVGIEDVKKLGLDFNEMTFGDLRDVNELDIAKAFGVPAGMVGIKAGLERNTFTNFESSIQDFYQRTVMALWARLDGSFTRGLLPDFIDPIAQPNISVEFDVSDVSALQDDLTPERQWAIDGWNNGIMLLDEARVIGGLPELEGAQGKVRKGRISDIEIPVSVTAGAKRARVRVSTIAEATDPQTRAIEPGPAKRERIAYGSDGHRAIMERHERRASVYEQRIAKKVASLMREQQAAILKTVKAQRSDGIDIETRAAGDYLPDKDIWDGTFADGIEPVFRAVAEDLGNAVLDDLNVSTGFDVYDKTFSTFLSRKAQTFATEVNDTTWTSLKASLTEGIEAGENIQSLAARVSDVMEGRIASSASTIARTEYAAISSGGTIEAWRQSEVVIGKEWLSSLTETTRATHEAAHEQRRKLDEDFHVGNATGSGPGLMSTAEETVNCQCYVQPIIEGEEI